MYQSALPKVMQTAALTGSHSANVVINRAYIQKKQAAQRFASPGYQAEATATSPQFQPQPSLPQNNTGLPDRLKAGIESLSGMSMDHVKVHYNSRQPAQLNALAYAQGSEIHLAPGQERHLPHEAWHIVQQAQGRVKPTMQMKGGETINDDSGLEREADVMGVRAMALNPLQLGEGTILNTGSMAHSLAIKPNCSGTIQRAKIQADGTAAATKGANLFGNFTTETDNLNPKVTKYASDLKADKTTFANEKALGFGEWAKSAVYAAQRYYAEWKVAEEGGILNNAFGYSDVTDPDITVNLFKKGKRAVEVKNADTENVSAIDEHVRKGSEQLNKRIKSVQIDQGKTSPGDFVEHDLHLYIRHEKNHWPFSKTDHTKLLGAPTTADVTTAFNKRKGLTGNIARQSHVKKRRLILNSEAVGTHTFNY